MRTRIQRMRRTWRTRRILRIQRIRRIRILIHLYCQAIFKVAWVIIVNVGGLFLFNREVTVKISV